MFYQKVTSGEQSSKYNVVTSGKSNSSVSKSDCEKYAISKGKELRTDITDRLTGCSVSYSPARTRDDISMVYYGSENNNNTCGTRFGGNSNYFSDCVQKHPNYVSEEQCKAYAIKNNFHDSYDVVEYPNEAPEGCIIKDNVGVRYNKSTCLSKCKCGETNWDCIQIR